eukprot:TRINITY_DN2570_c0_g1_i1.p1 TRINITY_DN2570_c0_g1~~TRINITY_DN2570_c0_g1_i1.p1  ORF type:complete len:508 (-),score=104.14 TRINITY_DN2570_c0_g1_i1:90-1613(-)
MVVRKRWLALVGMGALLYVVRRRRRAREKARLASSEASAANKASRSQAATQRATASAAKTAASVYGSSSGQRASVLRQSSSFNLGKSNVDIGGVLGMDIGGTLAKLVYFEKKEPPGGMVRTCSRDPLVTMKRNLSLGDLNTREQKEALMQFYTFMDTQEQFGKAGVRDEHLAYYSHELGGQLHFFRFETRLMDQAIELISSSTIHNSIKAYKFEDFFQKRMGIRMLQMDEMASLVRGLQFCIANIPGECYAFEPEPVKGTGANGKGEEEPMASEQDTFRNMRMRHMSELREKVDYSHKVHRSRTELLQSYPALVVSIGSGVSILKVDGPAKFERVSGSSIGGGTYWGLCRLLTGATDYDDSLDLADQGESDRVDMLVGDIYGHGYNKFQLSSNTLASSFGKLVTKEDPREGVTNEDVSKALIVMVTMNIGQVAYLNAKLYDTRRIYFVGNFLRHNNISAQRLAYAIAYWSGGEMEALFFEHEGYLGALGAFLSSGYEDPDGSSDEES